MAKDNINMSVKRGKIERGSSNNKLPTLFLHYGKIHIIYFILYLSTSLFPHTCFFFNVCKYLSRIAVKNQLLLIWRRASV